MKRRGDAADIGRQKKRVGGETLGQGFITHFHIEVRGVAEDGADLVCLGLHVDLELLDLALLRGRLKFPACGLFDIGHGGG